MKAFLANLTLARLIIILSIPGSIYLAWAGYESQTELETMRRNMTMRVPNLLREIQELAKLNTKLEKDIKGDQYIGKDSLETYVRYCADHRQVGIGDVAFTRGSSPGQGGVVDKKLTIRPSDSKRAYTHAAIAAFAYRLEADSNQVKVTNIRYTLLGKGIMTDDVTEDTWTFDIIVTNRVKEEKKRG
jgi:hypothetical protein